jgi:F-type H+-transporting ATPase subunit gamma
VISQVPTAQQLIPANVPKTEKAMADARRSVYDYEPDESEILEDLLPRNIDRADLQGAA